VPHCNAESVNFRLLPTPRLLEQPLVFGEQVDPWRLTRADELSAAALSGAASYCSSRRISSCSGTVSKVPVPAGICINGLALGSSSQTLG